MFAAAYSPKLKKLMIGALLVCAQLTNAVATEPIRLVVGYQPYDTISYSAVVIRALELWKKYLPPGSEVVFQEAMQGTIIVNRMQSGNEQIGYLGDMPAAVASSQRDIAPIKLVANIGFSQGQRCGIVMVRADAPKFNSPQEAMAWLDGKTIATPRGSCADRFLRTLVSRQIVKPAAIQNYSLEVIATKFLEHDIDGAVLWESTASRIGDLVGDGRARLVATGYSFDMQDAGALAMREDFMRDHPAIAEGWLKAELEAQRYVLDPRNWTKVAQFVHQQTIGVTPRMAWFSLYGAIPHKFGGSAIRDEKPFVFDTAVRAFFERTYGHLHRAGLIDVDHPPPGAIDDTVARKVAADAGVTLPLGMVRARSLSAAPK